MPLQMTGRRCCVDIYGEFAFVVPCSFNISLAIFIHLLPQVNFACVGSSLICAGQIEYWARTSILSVRVGATYPSRVFLHVMSYSCPRSERVSCLSITLFHLTTKVNVCRIFWVGRQRSLILGHILRRILFVVIAACGPHPSFGHSISRESLFKSNGGTSCIWHGCRIATD